MHKLNLDADKKCCWTHEDLSKHSVLTSFRTPSEAEKLPSQHLNLGSFSFAPAALTVPMLRLH